MVRSRDARSLRNVGERAIAVVPIEDVPASGKAFGSTVSRDAFPHAMPGGSGQRRRLGIELQVGPHEQIQQSVTVVIDEGAPCAPALRSEQSRLFGDVGERAITVIAVKNVVAPATQEQI